MANQNTTLAALTKIVNTDANGQPISVKPAYIPGATGILLDVNSPVLTSTGLVTLTAGAVGNSGFNVLGDQTAVFTVGRSITFQNTRLNGQIFTVSSSQFTTATIVTFTPALVASEAFAIGATIYTATGGPQTQTNFTEIEFPGASSATVASGRAIVNYPAPIAPIPPTIYVDVNTPTFATIPGATTTTAGVAGATTFTLAGNQIGNFYTGLRIGFQLSQLATNFYLITSSVFGTDTTVTFSPALAAADAFAIGAIPYLAYNGPRTQTSINEIEFSGYTPTFTTLPGGIKASLNSARFQRFTAAGTFTVPAGITNLKMIILGAGGGAGSSNIQATGGLGQQGVQGGNTSVLFNNNTQTLYTATGGNGGDGGGLGTANGREGQIVVNVSGANTFVGGSMGGYNIWSGAIGKNGSGRPGTATTLGSGGFGATSKLGSGTGGTAFGFGAGGGGGSGLNVTGSIGGWGGGPGAQFTTYLTVTPGQIATITIGVGGTGGISAGTNSGAGGVGAPGVVIFEW